MFRLLINCRGSTVWRVLYSSPARFAGKSALVQEIGTHVLADVEECEPSWDPTRTRGFSSV